MTHINFIFRIISILTLSVILSSQAFAGPAVSICLNDSCKKNVSVEISNDTWKSVTDIFSTPFPTDKDEQDNIISSYTLLRADVYNTLAQNNNLGDGAEVLYEINSTEAHYKNAKTLIALLLDKHLIKRHYFRKTIKRSTWSKAFSWAGFTSMDSITSVGLMLQSLTDAKQYVFEIDGDFSEPTIIVPYSH